MTLALNAVFSPEAGDDKCVVASSAVAASAVASSAVAAASEVVLLSPKTEREHTITI